MNSFCSYVNVVPSSGAGGEFHDQGDAKWIVSRRSLWGHDDMPCGQPAPSRPIAHLESGRPQGVIGVS
jgi:hypothetical protein